MPSSVLVSQVVSSSRRNGDSWFRWSRKKKKVLGSLVSRTCGAAMCANSAMAMRSSRHASDSPSVRRNFDRPLPAVAGDIARPHRCRSVLEDDEIHAGRPQQRDLRGRPRQRQNVSALATMRQSQNIRPPKIGNALAHRQPAMLPVMPRVAPAPNELPDPHDGQHRRRHQQPEVNRLGEPNRADVNSRLAPRHALSPQPLALIPKPCRCLRRGGDAPASRTLCSDGRSALRCPPPTA